MRKLIATGLGILAVTAPCAFAQIVNVVGVGSDSCGSYVLALAKNAPTRAMRMDEQLYYTDAATYAQWVSGYVTANAFAGRPIPSHIDFNGIMIWVKNYCDSNPTYTIAHAAQAFVQAHRSKAK